MFRNWLISNSNSVMFIFLNRLNWATNRNPLTSQCHCNILSTIHDCQLQIISLWRWGSRHLNYSIQKRKKQNKTFLIVLWCWVSKSTISGSGDLFSFQFGYVSFAQQMSKLSSHINLEFLSARPISICFLQPCYVSCHWYIAIFFRNSQGQTALQISKTKHSNYMYEVGSMPGCCQI